MKTIIYFSILLLFSSSCSTGPEKDETMDFIPGIFVRQSQNEYGRSYDTLFISVQNIEANEYSIDRRTRYHRILDGIAQPPETKKRKTTAVYDADKKSLRESQSNDIFTFDLEKQILYNGTNQFTKIN